MQKEDDIIDAFRWIEKHLGSVSILINSAGVFPYGDMVMNGDTNSWREVFETNVLGLCIATREAIRIMKNEKTQGHIIHLNSVAGHRIPICYTGLSVYPASKHAVTALTETLRVELVQDKCNIKITVSKNIFTILQFK